jgi:hypothetical protein
MRKDGGCGERERESTGVSAERARDEKERRKHPGETKNIRQRATYPYPIAR